MRVPAVTESLTSHLFSPRPLYRSAPRTEHALAGERQTTFAHDPSVDFAHITRDAKVQYAPKALECRLKRSLLKTSTGRKPACSLQRNRIEIGPVNLSSQNRGQDESPIPLRQGLVLRCDQASLAHEPGGSAFPFGEE
jgi:hypothetical protein